MLSSAHLGVHIGTIQVHLAAVLVNKITHFSDMLLKHAKGGRVGEHHGCQTCLVLIRLEERAGFRSQER